MPDIMTVQHAIVTGVTTTIPALDTYLRATFRDVHNLSGLLWDTVLALVGAGEDHRCIFDDGLGVCLYLWGLLDDCVVTLSVMLTTRLAPEYALGYNLVFLGVVVTEPRIPHQ